MPLEEALDVLFHRHGALVYRRALQLLGQPDAAEEAVQEVFIRAMRAGDRFDPRARPSTWLYRITTNYCLNQIRDARRRRELIDARVDEATPASQPATPPDSRSCAACSPRRTPTTPRPRSRFMSTA